MKNLQHPQERFIPAGAGARHSQADPATALRFIPAGAGSTPRRCIREIAGLSPLARGTLFGGAVVPLFFRFIPAGAGNTSTCSANGCPSPVYPRWRGEHNGVLIHGRSAGGLSPLARGTHKLFRQSQERHAVVPAGAGNTYKKLEIKTVEDGLSPLARGTLI